MCSLKPQKKSKQGSEASLNSALLHCAEQGKASQNHINKATSEKNRGKKITKENKKTPSVSGEQAPHQVNEECLVENEECLVEALSANAI